MVILLSSDLAQIHYLLDRCHRACNDFPGRACKDCCVLPRLKAYHTNDAGKLQHWILILWSGTPMSEPFSKNLHCYSDVNLAQQGNS
jgi:hypothetical protein